MDIDSRTLEKYAQNIWGCSYEDLSDREFDMLVAHIKERESDATYYGSIL